MANDALSPPTAIRLAQASAILLAATTAGANASLSFFVIPQILASSGRSAAAAARRWAAMFAATSRVFPASMCGAPAALNAFLAWRFFRDFVGRLGAANGSIAGAHHTKVRAILYAAVAAATLSLAPYTWFVMGPVNRQLLARSARPDVAATDGAGEGEDEEEEDDGATLVEEEARTDRETTHALVDKWGTRNLYRAAVSFLAASAGLYAALS